MTQPKTSEAADWIKKAAERRSRAAAKKAARTRRANYHMLKRWREVDEPAMRRREMLFNHLLARGPKIWLHWNPTTDTGHKLKNGARYGTLIKVLNGGNLWRVLPEGYKQPKDWHPAFWEVLLP